MYDFPRFIRDIVHPLNLWMDGEWGEYHYLREYERTQYLPADELRALARERLKKLLDHAYRYCPYYRTSWDRLGLIPSDVRELEDLCAFPVLSKTEIQRHRDAMVAENWARSDLIANQTGGSTGAPISFFHGVDRVLSRNAAAWRHNRWAEYDIGDKVAKVWGAAQDVPRNKWKVQLRNLLIDRTLYLDTACFTEAKLRSFHESLQRFRPKTILAYARALTFLARYLKEQGLQPYQPRSIITSAEVLDAGGRALIEGVFGCPVFDRYGSREVGVLASECSEHSGLHVMGEGLYVEVVCSDRLAAPGEIGKILVTDLLNPAMPLIRYQIGDMGAWEPGVCPCGRELPRLKSVAGRVTDFVVGSDGRLVSGVFLATYVVAKRPSLGQVQLWQDTPGRVLYKIARSTQRSVSGADVKYLEHETQRYLGDNTVVEYEAVNELLPEPSGKFIFCRSTVADDYFRIGQGTP